MFGGCSIYRESMPEVKYFAPGGINGAIMVTRTGLTFTMPLDDFGGFRSAEITANDWAYECPGHRWEYSANGEWRGCHICEAEETGVVVREAWRATFKSLPAAGTTHPDPVRCCDDYPACDCAAVRSIWPGGVAPIVGVGWWCGCGCHHALETDGCPLCGDRRLKRGMTIKTAMGRMSNRALADLINAVPFGIMVPLGALQTKVVFARDFDVEKAIAPLRDAMDAMGKVGERAAESIRWLAQSPGWSMGHIVEPGIAIVDGTEPTAWRCQCGGTHGLDVDECPGCGHRRVIAFKHEVDKALGEGGEGGEN